MTAIFFFFLGGEGGAKIEFEMSVSWIIIIITIIDFYSAVSLIALKSQGALCLDILYL